METIKTEYITKKNLLHGLDLLFGTTVQFDKGNYLWNISGSGINTQVSIMKEELDIELDYVRNNISFDDDFCMVDRTTKLLEKLVQPLNSYKTIIASHKLNPLTLEHSSNAAIVSFLCYCGHKEPAIEVSWFIDKPIIGLNKLCSMIDLRSIHTTETLRKVKNDLTNVVLYLLAKKYGVYYIDTICDMLY